MNDETLAEAVNAWFKRYGTNPHRWIRTKTGNAIRSNLQATGNWRNAPRGNPAKGREEALRNKQNESNGSTQEALLAP